MGKNTHQFAWPGAVPIAALLVLLIAPPALAQANDPLAERAGQLLAEAIRIPTVNPPGAEAALARRIVEVAREGGLEARLVPTPTAEGAPPRAAAWVRARGRGGPGLVLLSHLDVVPADPASWSGGVDPFEGALRDGQVIGRGALDAKGVTIVHLLTLLELARREQPLTRDVVLLATPDEETGGLEGAGWLTREHPELLAGADALLTEGGSIRLRARGAPVWGVAVTEKSPCWLELAVSGTPGHSSAPRPDAAVPRLVAALDRVRRIETPIRVVPEVAEMFRAAAPLAPPEDRPGYADLETALGQDPVFRRRFLEQAGRAALVRNTLSITVLEGGSRTNVAPVEARAHLDIRLLPGERCEAFRDSIEEVIDDPSLRVRVLLTFPSRSSPLDTPLYRAIERTAKQLDPEAQVVPRVVAGFTDAHWFRELGIVSYGFVPRRLAAADTRGVHGVDERVSVRNLAYGVRTLVRILEELDALEAE